VISQSISILWEIVSRLETSQPEVGAYARDAGRSDIPLLV